MHLWPKKHMNTTHRSFPRWLALVALSIAAAMPAFAQTATSPAASVAETIPPKRLTFDETGEQTVDAKRPTKALKLEEVKVLGSRIRQVETEGPSPVTKYDQEYVKATVALTLADFLNYMPQNYAGIGAGRGSTPNELNPEFGQRTETTSPGFNFVLGVSAAGPGQTGVSGVSLRGLGAGSTLVLVDGRRVAKSGFGNRSSDSQQGFVDLNGIPLGMIERVEVITDGSSAIYGADAVGGVVNVILKKDWRGSELSGSFRGAFHGGAVEKREPHIGVHGGKT